MADISQAIYYKSFFMEWDMLYLDPNIISYIISCKFITNVPIENEFTFRWLSARLRHPHC